MNGNNDDEKNKKVMEVLKQIKEKTNVEYSPEKQKKTKEKLSRYIWARTPMGMLCVGMVVFSIVYICGRIFGWW